MVVFLIIVSLIFHVIALLAIVILYLRQNKLLQVEKQQKKAMEEMEQLIHSYLLEMKDENEDFIQKVKEMQSEQPDKDIAVKSFSFKDDRKLNPAIQTVEKPQSTTEDDDKEGIETDDGSFYLTAKLEKAVSLQAFKAYQQQAPTKRGTLKSPVEENLEKDKSLLEMKQAFSQADKEKAKQSNTLIQDSLLTQVMIMKQEGLTETEIAQKLKKGKTEIELLLKFRENQRE